MNEDDLRSAYQFGYEEGKADGYSNGYADGYYDAAGEVNPPDETRVMTELEFLANPDHL